MNGLALGVSDFVALVNQTLDFTYPNVTIVGELANFRVSKNKWVYFDLKDELASVRFFGMVYSLPGPIEDGMLLEVRGAPRLHPQFGFSVTMQALRPVGEGSIKKAANLLEARLRAEGLFDEARKRPLPYPPQTIGLVTSKASAAYADFTKVLATRWRGLTIQLIDVQVQGEAAPGQVVRAIEQFNQMAVQPEVLVVIRGGGSADDLRTFSTEQVTRAVAASRIPTLVAVGHEVDVSLTELAADQRASTPSNAAELLTPDKREVSSQLHRRVDGLSATVARVLAERRQLLRFVRETNSRHIDEKLDFARLYLNRRQQLVTALSPETTLHRGYAIVRNEQGEAIKSGGALHKDQPVAVQFFDATAAMLVVQVKQGR